MKEHGRKQSLYGALLGVNIIPIFLLALVITAFGAHSFARTLNREVRKGLQDLSSTILTMYDQLYPGDYQAVTLEDGLYMLKGDHQINGDFSIIDTIKESTGADVTVFYQDVRVITTLYNDQGERMIGTKVNAVVVRDVLETMEPAFYPSVNIDGTPYFAYYNPIVNSDGSLVGMLFVAKPTQKVYESIWASILPMIFLGIVAMLLAGVVTVRFSRSLLKAISGIERFLGNVTRGNLDGTLDYEVLRREDELGEMGRYALKMQKSLIEQVDRDGLTGIDNRRSGEKLLKEVCKSKAEEGVDFCIALGDIDFFKRINDTYGHACGDQVLIEISHIMKNSIKGKGFVSRWGGEEFLIVYRDYKLEKALEELEKLLQEIREKEIEYQEEKVHITMTFGMVQGTMDTPDSMLSEADQKLYAGKQNGRNQIVP